MDCFNHKSTVDIHIKKPRHSEVFLFIASIVFFKSKGKIIFYSILPQLAWLHPRSRWRIKFRLRVSNQE
jgi:hypothetical protein